MNVARPEADSRIDAHEREAARGESQSLDLGLVHGVHVGDAEPAGGEQLALVGGLARLGRTDRRGARGEGHPFHLGPEALLQQRSRAADVHVEQPLAVLARTEVTPAQ